VAAQIQASQSGVVPGGGKDGRVWNPSFIGGKHRLNRVSAMSFRVLSARNRYYVVIFLFFEILPVKVCTPPY
jgi:hypothetical protein